MAGGGWVRQAAYDAEVHKCRVRSGIGRNHLGASAQHNILMIDIGGSREALLNALDMEQ